MYMVCVCVCVCVCVHACVPVCGMCVCMFMTGDGVSNSVCVRVM